MIYLELKVNVIQQSNDVNPVTHDSNVKFYLMEYKVELKELADNYVKGLFTKTIKS